MVTLKDIAKECGVSATTVSNILNGKPKVSEETRNRILEVVRRTGYQPNYIAQGLRRQKSQMIGIIAEDINQFSTPGIIESVMASFEKNGYRTIVQNLRLYARWREEWYCNEEAFHSVFDAALQETLSIKMDGLLYIAGHARIIRGFPEDFAIPTVMAYAYAEQKNIPSVVIDDEKGGYEITQYLIRMGHRSIGVIAGRADNIHTQKRLLGYQKALYEAQIPYNPELVYYGDWQREGGYQGTGPLLKAGVTALLCMSDRSAGGAYDYLEEHDLRAGQDISVVGYDNQDLAEYFRPGLTTMQLPLAEIGTKAAELLLDKIEYPEMEEKAVYRIPCKMILRNSVCQKDLFTKKIDNCR